MYIKSEEVSPTKTSLGLARVPGGQNGEKRVRRSWNYNLYELSKCGNFFAVRRRQLQSASELNYIL